MFSHQQMYSVFIFRLLHLWLKWFEIWSFTVNIDYSIYLFYASKYFICSVTDWNKRIFIITMWRQNINVFITPLSFMCTYYVIFQNVISEILKLTQHIFCKSIESHYSLLPVTFYELNHSLLRCRKRELDW